MRGVGAPLQAAGQADAAKLSTIGRGGVSGQRRLDGAGRAEPERAGVGELTFVCGVVPQVV